jgi:M6 family metalloprotease-like protein
VSQNASYYGSNDSQGNDKYAGKMVIEALKLADSEVNYKDYDWNDDDEVDQVYLVYAGKGEADGGASNTIWPHAYTLDEAKGIGDGDGAQTLDGVRIDSYACGAELNGSSGKIAGIGTMCHEFSHCLGYPDFYDTDYSGGQGMFQWDLMDSGSYNGDGYLPAGYTSYERWVAGWLMPKELSTTMTVNNMKSLQDGGESYVIYNQGNRNEFYLLENRQQTSWDAGIPGKGLLILHVDYDADAWRYNIPNDDLNHQRMTWVAADNKYQYTVYNGERSYTEEGAKNDPFPYGSVNAFNKNTTPAAKFYNKNSDGTKYMDSSVEEITQNSDGTVSFKFVAKEDMSSPVPTDPTTVTGSGNFDLVTDATTLNAGDQILIACVADGEAMALGTNQKTNNREAVTVTLNSDGSLIPSDDTQVITLEKDGSDFLFNVGNGYLYAANSDKNWLRTESEVDDNALANISIADNGDATIEFQGDYTHNLLMFNKNNGSPIFSCYLSTSTVVKLPQIYRKTVGQGGDDPTGDDTPTQAEIQLGEGKTMAGYSFSETLDFSGVTNGKAWIASGFTRGTKVMLCRVEIVPANTGFVVTSDTPGDKIIAPVSSEKAYYANLLIPILEEKTIYPTQIIDGVDYTFMGIGTIAATGKTGFVKVPREQTYGPNKSLLKVPTEYLVNEARGLDELEIVFDETSSINETLEMNWRPGAESQFATAQIYDLQGRRIKGEGTATATTQLKKGIYIYKGKKIVIK